MRRSRASVRFPPLAPLVSLCSLRRALSAHSLRFLSHSARTPPCTSPPHVSRQRGRSTGLLACQNAGSCLLFLDCLVFPCLVAAPLPPKTTAPDRPIKPNCSGRALFCVRDRFCSPPWHAPSPVYCSHRSRAFARRVSPPISSKRVCNYRLFLSLSLNLSFPLCSCFYGLPLAFPFSPLHSLPLSPLVIFHYPRLPCSLTAIATVNKYSG